MKLELQNAVARKNSGYRGESRAYVLLESARLRCESLMAVYGQHEHLRAIHREIGLAGYVTCAEFDELDRHDCLAFAATRIGRDPEGAGAAPAAGPLELGPTLAKMFSETISASDALAGELAEHDVDGARRDRLHLVHAHVMSACELLDECLTALELENAGADAVS